MIGTRRAYTFAPPLKLRANRTAVLFVITAALAACGAPNTVEQTAASSEQPVEIHAVHAGTAGTCHDGSVHIARVDAHVVDSLGAPVAYRPVSVCGSVCLSGRTDADGNAHLVSDACFVVDDVHPFGAVFTVHGIGLGPDVTVPVLPSASDATVYAPPADVRAPDWSGASRSARREADGTVVVTDATGFEMTVPVASGFAIADDDMATMRAERMPLDAAVERDASGAGIEALFAVSMPRVTLAGDVMFALPNVSHLPAGTAVDVLAVGTAHSEGHPAAGMLDVVASGHVSADGAHVVPDHGLPFVSWVGYRTSSFAAR